MRFDEGYPCIFLEAVNQRASRCLYGSTELPIALCLDILHHLKFLTFEPTVKSGDNPLVL